MSLPVENALEYPVQLALSLIVTLLLGIPIRYLLDMIGERVEIPRPLRIPSETWDALIAVPRYLGGTWIGILERFIFFAAVAVGAPELAIAWLAFKVASKWEAWNNMYKVPDKFPNATLMESLLARSRWGARTFQRFVVGTAANLVAAVIGIATLQWLVLFGICLC